MWSCPPNPHASQGPWWGVQETGTGDPEVTPPQTSPANEFSLQNARLPSVLLWSTFSYMPLGAFRTLDGRDLLGGTEVQGQSRGLLEAQSSSDWKVMYSPTASKDRELSGLASQCPCTGN